MGVSYWVFSANKYIEPLSPRVAAKLAPEEINSMKFLAPTETSFPRHLSMPSAPYFIKEPDGEISVVRRTSNNIFKTTLDDYKRNGDFSPQIDDVLGYDTWKAAGEDYGPSHFNRVKLPKKTSSSGVIEGFWERLAEFHERDTPVKNYVHDFYIANLPYNDVGKAVSHIENLRQSLIRYYRTNNAQELVAYLKSLGLSPEDIGSLAVGFLPEDAIFGVARTTNDKILLSAADNVYDKISEQARLFGVEAEDFRNYSLDEEYTHIWRRSVDKTGSLISEEIATKKAVRNHYLRQAKRAAGNDELRRHYEKLAAIKQHDIDTTRARYQKDKVASEELYNNDETLEEILTLEVDKGQENYTNHHSKLEQIAERDAEPE